jgi:hypothetical protein
MLFDPLFSEPFFSFPFLAGVAQLAIGGGSPLVIKAPTPFTPRPAPHPGQQIVQSLFKLLCGNCH